MLGPASALTLSGRYNQARLVLEDGLGTALNGTHDYSRFNPGIGLSLTPSPQFNPYVSYNEGMRVPTPVELTCASPQSPCSLPNAFSADPGLKAVVSRTWELGVRSRLDNGVRLSAALFRTDLQDDIQFVSSGGSATTAGYFENVGSTRRQGLELGLEAKAGRATVSAHYSLVDATYRSALVLNSPSNSSAAPITCAGCADIQVTPGDRIPGIPMQQFNLRLRYELLPQLNVGATLVAQSSVFARGDENNLDQHGPVPGFAVLNFDANWELQRGLSLFATVSNVFDRAYATYGVLGQNVFTGPGNSFDPSGASWHADQFRAPGAPLGAWLGIRYRIGPAG
jgi:outer membrane receptor protein involved in Fe transport